MIGIRTVQVATVAGLAAMAAGCGGKLSQYSAEQVTKTADGKVQHTAHLFVAPGKIRVEQMSPDGKPTMIAIYRQDLKVVRMLMPEQKSCFETKLNEGELEKTLKTIPTGAKEEVLGTETVNGFVCKKKKVQTTTKVFFTEVKNESIVWVSDRLGFPLRTQHKDGSVTELQGIKPGHQAASLFEVPADYKTTANPLEAFANSANKMEDKGPRQPIRMPFVAPPKTK